MMKSVKFLAALCIAAMFTSCAKDEYVAQDNFTEVEKYVGADLIGANVSIDFGKGFETKLTSADGWQDRDVIGLGWLVNGSYNAVQDKGTAPSSSDLYANHMYEFDGNGSFTTKGNLYRGWHFAYYPYAYEEVVAQQKKVVVNPVQTLKGKSEVWNDMLHLSARKFLTKYNLDGTMKLQNVKFDMMRVFSALIVNVKPSADFTGSETLSASKIKSITIDAGENLVFAEKVALNVKNLPEMKGKSSTDTTYNEAKTRAALLEALPNVVSVDGALKNSVTTTVKNDDIKLNGNQELRIFVVPGNFEDLSAEDLKVTVAVEGGLFTINYADEDEDDTTDEMLANNEVLEAIAAAFKTGKEFGSYAGKGTTGIRDVVVDLELTADMYTVDFSGISNASEWNQAVRMVNDLNLKNKVFEIDGKIVIDSQNALTLPTNTIKAVMSDKAPADAGIYVASDYTMSKAMATALSKVDADGNQANNNHVIVNKGVTLTLDGDNAAAVLKVGKITNRGTINLNKYSTLYNTDNTEGRINVVYGSYIYNTATGKEGVIAYNVTGEDKAIQINAMMGKVDNANPSATTAKAVNINTIVVGDGKSFNLSLNDLGATAGDYNEGYLANYGLDADYIAKMTIEMNGGSLSNGVPAKVKVLSGNNTLTNVSAAKLEVVKDAAVNVETAYASGKVSEVYYSEIYNDGTLTIKTDVYCDDIKTDENGTTFVERGVAKLFYTGTYPSQNGTVQGTVAKSPYVGDADELNVTKVNTNTAFETALASSTVKNIKLGASITLKTNAAGTTGCNISINGKNIDGNGYSISAGNKAEKGYGDAVFTVGADATVKNLTFVSPNSQYDIKVTAGTLTIDNCKFETATNGVKVNDATNGASCSKRAIYVAGTATVNVTNSVIAVEGYVFNVASGNPTFAFTNCELRGWFSGEGAHTFTKCTFGKSGDLQSYVPYGTATINECKFETGFNFSLKHADSYTFDGRCLTSTGATLTQPQQLIWNVDGDGSQETLANVTINGVVWTSTLTEDGITFAQAI